MTVETKVTPIPTPTPEPTSTPSALDDTAAADSLGSDDDDNDGFDESIFEAKPGEGDDEVTGDGKAPAPLKGDSAAQVAATPPAAPAPGIVAPAAPPPPTQPALVAPVALATPPATPTPTAAPASPGAVAPIAAVTPQDPLAQYKTWRTDAEKALSDTHYVLPRDLAEEMAADPAATVPKLMARVYLDAVEASVNAVAALMPQVINSTIASREAAAGNEKDFFDTWPQLKEHKGRVTQIGATYRQINPQADKTTFIRDVGAQAVLALGLPLGAPSPQPGTVVLPHRPLASSARQVGGPTPQANVFSELAEQERANPYDD